MNFTTATTPARTAPVANKFLYLLVSVFLVYWIYGWLYNHNMENWIIENLLVMILVPVLFLSRK